MSKIFFIIILFNVLNYGYLHFIYASLSICIDPRLELCIGKVSVCKTKANIKDDKVCQWLVTGWWFSPVSSKNKTDRHDITEILLKVALNIITLHPPQYKTVTIRSLSCWWHLKILISIVPAIETEKHQGYTCSNLIWWIQKAVLKLLASPTHLTFENLGESQLKMASLGTSSRWVERIPESHLSFNTSIDIYEISNNDINISAVKCSQYLYPRKWSINFFYKLKL
jgi:hypothetical protein